MSIHFINSLLGCIVWNEMSRIFTNKREREKEKKWSLLLKSSHCQCLLELTILQFPKASQLYCTHFNNNRISQCTHTWLGGLVREKINKQKQNSRIYARLFIFKARKKTERKIEKFRMQPFECVYLKISRCLVTLTLCVRF